MDFILIGDSITYGYQSGGVGQNAPVLLSFASALSIPPSQVLNLGFNGATSSDWTGSRLTDALSLAQPNTIFLVCLGANDAKIGRSDGEFAFHYKNIVNTVHASGHIVIANEALYLEPGHPPFPDDAFKTISLYNKRLDETGASIGDTSAYEFFQQNPSLLSDGVHPNSEGAQWLGQAWASAVQNTTAPEPCSLALLIPCLLLLRLLRPRHKTIPAICVRMVPPNIVVGGVEYAPVSAPAIEK